MKIDPEELSKSIVSVRNIDKEINFITEFYDFKKRLISCGSSWTYNEEIANKFKDNPDYKVSKGWFGKYKIKFLK